MPNLAATETRGAASRRARTLGVALPVPVAGDRPSDSPAPVSSRIR